MEDKIKNRDNLVDITGIEINPSLLKEERINEFINKIGNPYYFKVGKLTVKISFIDTEESLQDRLIKYMKTSTY